MDKRTSLVKGYVPVEMKTDESKILLFTTVVENGIFEWRHKLEDESDD